MSNPYYITINLDPTLKMPDFMSLPVEIYEQETAFLLLKTIITNYYTLSITAHILGDTIYLDPKNKGGAKYSLGYIAPYRYPDTFRTQDKTYQSFIPIITKVLSYA